MSLAQHLIDHATLGIAPADPVGTAASLVAGHEASANPHPSYLTEVEADAKYALIGEGGGAAIIRTPEPISPLTNTTEFAVDGTLQASAYAPLYSADSRDYREFNIDVIAGDFSNPVVSIQVDSDSWSISPNIVDNTDYKWRCRDKSLNGDYSAWSDVQSFKTFDIYVVTPSITFPTEGGEFAEKGQAFTSSAFQIVNSSDAHAASYWVIKNNSGVVVYQTGRDTVNLTSFTPPDGIVVVGQTMSVEVCYESSSGFLSEYGIRSFIGVAAPYGKYLAVAHSTTPRITAYGQDVDTYIKLPDPTVLPTSDAYATKISKDGRYVAIGTINSPYLYLYELSNDELTPISNPADMPTGVNGVDFNSNSSLMAIAASASPYILLYSISSGVFTKLPNLGTLPTARANGVSISWDGVYMAVCFEVSPYVLIYKDTGSGFSLLSGALGSNPPDNSTGVCFSKDSQYLAVSHATSPFVTIYKRTGDSFTKLTNPSTLPTNTGRAVSFSDNANYLAVGHSTSPFVTIYSRSGDTFTKVTNPTTLPANTALGVSFILDGTKLAVAHQTSPFLTVYQNSGGTFSKLPNPVTLPTGTGNACSFYPAV